MTMGIQRDWDAVIVGGGAAGLWAAGTAAARGLSVLVLEKNNKAGVKILMSGGTRCNITHHCDSRKIAEAFGKNGKVLLSVLSRLSPQDVVRVFEEEGVATKVEDTGKVFPVSDRAIDVRNAVVRRLSRFGAQLLTGASVRKVAPSTNGDGYEIAFEYDGNSIDVSSRTVLITTGGLSYRECGTTGDGYEWAKQMGHTITLLRPALTPLLSNEAWVHELSGLTLDDVQVSARVFDSTGAAATLERNQSRGGFLWTHWGCSGPTAMNVSRALTEAGQESRCEISVDLLPDLSRVEVEQWILNASKESNRTLSNVIGLKVPRRLASTLIHLASGSHDPRMSELSKKTRNAILEQLKNLQIPIHGTRGYPKAEVTAGGVTLSEVNFQDMQSRVRPGLYFAGEILDLDGPIGGFNFQAAWSTGHTAGLHLGNQSR